MQLISGLAGSIWMIHCGGVSGSTSVHASLGNWDASVVPAEQQKSSGPAVTTGRKLGTSTETGSLYSMSVLECVNVLVGCFFFFPSFFCYCCFCLCSL